MNDEAVLLQDRISSILDAHLSNIADRLSSTARVLTALTAGVLVVALVALARLLHLI